jgi:pseudouridine synthase
VIRLPKGVVPVGRLDKDTSGLIFLTNDGVVARRIMDPAFDHEKEYEVGFFIPFTDDAAQRIEKGMYLRGERTKPVTVIKAGEFKARLILREGKNRQVRRLCEQNGYRVKKLKRVRVLNFLLGDMNPGEIKQLNRYEIKKLFAAIRLDREHALQRATEPRNGDDE